MRWPLVPVILASGHARERVGELRPGAVYMPKSWQPLNVLIAAERPWHLGWDAPALDHSRQAIAGITLSFHRETANSSRELRCSILDTGSLRPLARCVGRGGGSAMSRMLFVTLTLICWASPIKAEVLTLSCSGTMKAEEEQAKPHAITKMGLIVNFDAGVVTGFTQITARIDDISANSVAFNGTTIHPSGAEWSVHGRGGQSDCARAIGMRRER